MPRPRGSHLPSTRRSSPPSPATAGRDTTSTHVGRSVRELIDARLWLTVYQLPPRAPEFNPVEGVWSHLKGSLANFTSHSSNSSPRW
ncbi:transposase [Streptomyces galilaeus]|uniref:transposase n=1 Tax=Streptomyces galilaeus TaxID=33899 RepID=UPI0038F78459